MFEHIGVVAGMEGVAVAEHGRGRLKTGKGDYIRKCGGEGRRRHLLVNGRKIGKIEKMGRLKR
ncbi:hypothetical protein [Neisseria sicca]|uniref:hypothetical protein n=1 Tax=Neisseria sicca TaxID=490 RepID=UPI0028809D6F|nr:hypothetical protein [Neisseria sicca]